MYGEVIAPLYLPTTLDYSMLVRWHFLHVGAVLLYCAVGLQSLDLDLLDRLTGAAADVHCCIGASLFGVGRCDSCYLLLHGRPRWLMLCSSLLVVTRPHAW